MAGAAAPAFSAVALICCTACGGRGLPACIGIGRWTVGRFLASVGANGRPSFFWSNCCLASNFTGGGGGGAFAITGRFTADGGGTCRCAGAFPPSTASFVGATCGANENFACCTCFGSTFTAT